LKKRGRQDGSQKESYGWDVFNADSIYRAYEKRVNKIPKLLSGQAVEDPAFRVEMMAKEVQETIEKRN
jgi:hypothetical protein